MIVTMDERFLRLLSASALALPMLAAGQQATFDDGGPEDNLLRGRDLGLQRERPCAPGGGPSPDPPTNTHPILSPDELQSYYEDHLSPLARRLQNRRPSLTPLKPLKPATPPPPPGFTCTDYSMSYYDKDYETPEIMGDWVQWGFHALQWKGYKHIDAGGIYDPAPVEWAPGWDYPDSVKCSDADWLNDLEASGIYDVNPRGTWFCKTENDPHLGAIFAAMAMHYWKTPVYKNARGSLSFPPNEYWNINAMVIEKVTLCTSARAQPHEVCEWDTLDWASGQGGLGACAAQLFLDSVEVGLFSDIPMCGSTTPFGPHKTVSGADWAQYYHNWAGGDSELIWDPPAGVSGDAIATMQRMASATTEGMIAVGREGDDVKVVNVEVETNDGRGGLFGP